MWQKEMWASYKRKLSVFHSYSTAARCPRYFETTYGALSSDLYKNKVYNTLLEAVKRLADDHKGMIKLLGMVVDATFECLPVAA